MPVLAQFSFKTLLFLTVLFFTTCLTKNLQAKEPSDFFKAPKFYGLSTNINGMVGLNTVPNARMDEAGTVRLGLGTADPYLNAFIGFQLASPLYISFRQSAEVSGLNDNPKAFYQGVDLKLKLLEETATRPAFAVGMDSAIGQGRTASEYFVLSKRYKSFDFTGGVAWGRLGSKGHLKNPFHAISSHFKKPRNYSAAVFQDPNDWFTGEDIGFFGGVEYHTPLRGVSLKADYGADDYIIEESIDGYDVPDPWAISLNYKPVEQADLSLGILGGKKIMARLSLQEQLFDWPGASSRKKSPPSLTYPRKDGTGKNIKSISLSPFKPVARQIGRSARYVANNADINEENITLALHHKGLRGSAVTLMRNDLERAVIDGQASADEIWHDTLIEKNKSSRFNFKDFFFGKNNFVHSLRFILEQKIGLSEPNKDIIYRTSGLIEGEKMLPFGLMLGATGRVNIAHNLSDLDIIRLFIPEPIRSNEDVFASRRVGIDRFYTSWMRTITKDAHIALSAGYLEEMYGGFGGEILYRPFKKRFAIGAEGWKAYKRDPYSPLARDLFDDPVFTGHLNLFYEIPETKITAFVKAGQYLREDRGGTFGLKSRFDNGSTLEGFVTLSNQPEVDILGNRTHLYGGVKFTLPLGNIPYVPDGSEVRVFTGPIARDSGQIIDNPQPLYDVTEPISYRQMTQSWKTLLD